MLNDPSKLLANDPPLEDSEDLTDAEIERAVSTANAGDLSKAIVGELKRDVRFALRHHELRRRGSNLFWRTRLVTDKEPDRVLVYKVNWLGG
jgi:hypothetical protein